MKTVERNSNLLTIRFQSWDKDEWALLLTTVKSLGGREFHPKGKYWTAFATEENLAKLKQVGFDFLWDAAGVAEKQADDWKSVHVDVEKIPGLRPYQYDAIRFIGYRKGRALIGDEMGTGKTVMALSWARYGRKAPMLIVVPASIKLQWRREFRKWCSKTADVEVLYGKTSHRLASNCSYIINWDILNDWKEQLKQIPFRLIIGDEIQAIGNTGSKRSKAFKSLAKKIPEMVALSGTPIRSRPDQFYPILNLLDRITFYNQWAFRHRYCDPKHNGFGWDFTGASNVEELHALVSNIMIRRTKRDVLPDLPEKVKVVVPLDDVELKDYLRAADEMREVFQVQTNRQELERAFDYLKNSAFEAKKKSVVKWIENFIETGEKLVVFTYHRAVSEFLHERFSDRGVLIYGGISKGAREGAIQDFINNHRVRVLIGNIQSAGVGIDGLQGACSNSATVELGWSPTDHSQAEDRLHRIGQKDSVTSYYLIAPDTVEEEIVGLLDEKTKMIEQLVDGKAEAEIDLLGDLLRIMRKEKIAS